MLNVKWVKNAAQKSRNTNIHSDSLVYPNPWHHNELCLTCTSPWIYHRECRSYLYVNVHICMIFSNEDCAIITCTICMLVANEWFKSKPDNLNIWKIVLLGPGHIHWRCTTLYAHIILTYPHPSDKVKCSMDRVALKSTGTVLVNKHFSCNPISN